MANPFSPALFFCRQVTKNLPLKKPYPTPTNEPILIMIQLWLMGYPRLHLDNLSSKNPFAFLFPYLGELLM
jgi:hypothetical protein